MLTSVKTIKCQQFASQLGSQGRLQVLNLFGFVLNVNTYQVMDWIENGEKQGDNRWSCQRRQVGRGMIEPMLCNLELTSLFHKPGAKQAGELPSPTLDTTAT